MSRTLALISILAVATGCESLRSDEPGPSKPSARDVPDRDADPEAAAEPAVVGVRGLEAALRKGVLAPRLDDATYRVDPFVAALVFEELVATHGEPTFTHVEAKDPAPVGFLVGAVNEGGLWHALGLREGDVIEALGRVPLVDVEALGRALDGAENQVTVTIFREDISFTASYRLDGGLAWRTVLSGFSAVDDAPVDDELPATPDAIEEDEEGAATPAPAGRPKSRPSSRPKPARPSARPSRPSGGSSGAGASSAVKCTSSSQCTVAKRTFDDWVASPEKLQSGVDIVPAIRNDVHSGYKLKRVSSRSPIHSLGFRAGDKITHVNGRYLGDDAQAMALYFSLGSARVFKVRYERGGRKRVKTISVR